MLTAQQLSTLKAAIQSNSLPNVTDGEAQLAADFFNQPASPAYYVWRTAVAREEIYNETSRAGLNWDWSTYKAQSITEQNAWVQIFMGDTANFAKPNLRAGILAIFGNTGAQTTQRNHCLSIGRRLATKAEKLFAAGSGTDDNSASTMTFEGAITMQDVKNARSAA